jgi:hypothetical protein
LLGGHKGERRKRRSNEFRRLDHRTLERRNRPDASDDEQGGPKILTDDPQFKVEKQA